MAISKPNEFVYPQTINKLYEGGDNYTQHINFGKLFGALFGALIVAIWLLLPSLQEDVKSLLRIKNYIISGAAILPVIVLAKLILALA